jgi:hypothetical protein
MTCTGTYTAPDACDVDSPDTVTVTAVDQLQGTLTASASATVHTQACPHVTRTQGFWATHLLYTTSVFNSNVGAFDWGCRDVNTIGKVMGGFWSPISKTTTDADRSALDQARMQLAQQLEAAILNNIAFGSSPGAGVITGAEAAFCGTNKNLILFSAAILDAFNNSGDGIALPPGTVPGPASPQQAKAVANKVFWDTLP